MTQAATTKNWFSKLKQPPYQAAIGLIFMLFFLAFGGVISVGKGEISSNWGYQSAATGLMLYGVGNALVSITAEDVSKYWISSFISYAVLGGIALLVGWGFSGIALNDAGSYRWIFIVLTFAYLVMLSIISMMRGIVRFAEREEWSQPRERD